MLGPNVGERGENYCRLREAGPGSMLDVLGAGHKAEWFTNGRNLVSSSFSAASLQLTANSSYSSKLAS